MAFLAVPPVHIKTPLMACGFCLKTLWLRPGITIVRNLNRSSARWRFQITRIGIRNLSCRKYPECSYCTDLQYSEAAGTKHLEGVVVLQAIIQPDGRT